VKGNGVKGNGVKGNGVKGNGVTGVGVRGSGAAAAPFGRLAVPQPLCGFPGAGGCALRFTFSAISLHLSLCDQPFPRRIGVASRARPVV
jgi:hypothetical protein